MDRPLVRALRDRGFNVLTVDEQGMRGRSDAEQLALASRLGRVLYSRNTRDFQRLHHEYLASDRHHAGIIVVPVRYEIGEEIRRLLRLLGSRTEEQMLDALEFLSSWG